MIIQKKKFPLKFWVIFIFMDMIKFFYVNAEQISACTSSATEKKRIKQTDLD